MTSPDPIRRLESEHVVLHAIADPVRLEIVRQLALVSEATAADLIESTQVGKQTLHRHVGALVNLGVVHREEGASDGETPGRPPARFRLPPHIRPVALGMLGAGS